MSKEQIEILIAEADDAKDNGKPEEASDLYEEAALRQEMSPLARWWILYNLGGCYRALHKNHAATRHLSRAIDVIPSIAEPYYHLGRMAYVDGRYQEAALWLERCIQLEIPPLPLPLDLDIYNVDRYALLAEVYAAQELYGPAIKYADKAIAYLRDNYSSPSPENTAAFRLQASRDRWTSKLEGCSADYYDTIWASRITPSITELDRLQVMAEALTDRIHPPKPILDVGSGPGDILKFLPHPEMYWGLDISSVARTQVRAKGGNTLDSLESLKQEDKTFHGCILGEFLEHCIHDEDVLRQIASHIAPGGIMVASVPRYAVMKDPAHARDYTPTEFERLMSTVGEVTMLPSLHCWMICVVRVTPRY